MYSDVFCVFKYIHISLYIHYIDEVIFKRFSRSSKHLRKTIGDFFCQVVEPEVAAEGEFS